jgi:rhodanese-related sulfurtransferase
MNKISRETLKARLDAGLPLTLVMVTGEWEYRAKRIPGSIRFSRLDDALAQLDPDDEIVLYCADEHCNTSRHAYRVFESEGFTHLWHYAGGLAGWEAAGYPLEGEWVAPAQP